MQKRNQESNSGYFCPDFFIIISPDTNNTMFRNLLPLLLSLPLLTYAQKKQETLSKFIITESSRNGSDITSFDVQRKGYFVFYRASDGELLFANVSKATNEQSWGPVLDLKTKEEKETETTYEADVFRFRWKYANTYDKKTGYATVTLHKVYKPQGVVFIMKMVLTNLDEMIYKGYMEGTTDEDDFIP